MSEVSCFLCGWQSLGTQQLSGQLGTTCEAGRAGRPLITAAAEKGAGQMESGDDESVWEPRAGRPRPPADAPLRPHRDLLAQGGPAEPTKPRPLPSSGGASQLLAFTSGSVIIFIF